MSSHPGNALRRACERCGAVLRRGRPGTRCDPCSRRPDTAEQLRETGFFSQDAVRRALLAYDFGYLFRAVRRTAELTQVELGEVLEMEQDRISRIERGERKLRDIEIVARIATRLGIPPILLGFGADTTPHQGPQPVPAEPDPARVAEASRRFINAGELRGSGVRGSGRRLRPAGPI
ncbi:MAG: helix-turn-helix domain-containing protein [Pseudonocardiaceae bacterium]